MVAVLRRRHESAFTFLLNESQYRASQLHRCQSLTGSKLEKPIVNLAIQAGDFILLSGNIYIKMELFVKFMNTDIVTKSAFFAEHFTVLLTPLRSSGKKTGPIAEIDSLNYNQLVVPVLVQIGSQIDFSILPMPNMSCLNFLPEGKPRSSEDRKEKMEGQKEKETLRPFANANIVVGRLDGCRGQKLGETDDQKACDSLGVRKRPVGQTHREFRQGLVWHEEGAATSTPTVPPPTHHQHHHHHHHHRRHRQSYHRNLHQHRSTLYEP
ncbi:hypothetical protein ABVT39_026545 [Epinephelus coioides]